MTRSEICHSEHHNLFSAIWSENKTSWGGTMSYFINPPLIKGVPLQLLTHSPIGVMPSTSSQPLSTKGRNYAIPPFTHTPYIEGTSSTLPHPLSTHTPSPTLHTLPHPLSTHSLTHSPRRGGTRRLPDSDKQAMVHLSIITTHHQPNCLCAEGGVISQYMNVHEIHMKLI